MNLTEGTRQVTTIQGWRILVTDADDGIHYYDFVHTMRDGRTFSFTAEMKPHDPNSLIDDVLSYVDNFDVDAHAKEWLIYGGVDSKSEAIEIFENLRTLIWLLAVSISPIHPDLLKFNSN